MLRNFNTLDIGFPSSAAMEHISKKEWNVFPNLPSGPEDDPYIPGPSPEPEIIAPPGIVLYKLDAAEDHWSEDPVEIIQDDNGQYIFSGFSHKEEAVEVVLPNKDENGHDIIGIGNEVFQCCRNLRSIIIPRGITYIGEMSFDGCENLTSVSFPEGLVHISCNAFYYCSSLERIDLKNGIKRIDEGAFGECHNLSNVSIADTIEYIHGGSSFDNTPFLENLPDGFTIFGKFAFVFNGEIPDIIVIPDNVEIIGSDLFSYIEKDFSIEIPNSVKTIQNIAFTGCRKLRSIRIPASVDFIGYAAFSYCENLQNVVFDGDMPTIESDDVFEAVNSNCIATINSENSTWSDYPEGSIWNRLTIKYAQASNDRNTKIKYVGDNVETEVEISGQLTSEDIDDISQVKSIILGSDVTSIGDGAFENATELVSIENLDSIIEIGNNAFANCTKLKSVSLNPNMTQINYAVFYNCTSLSSITIPDTVRTIGNEAFENCSSLKQIVLPKDLRQLGRLAFSNTGLSSIVFNDKLDNISHEQVFSRNDSLTDLIIPENITYIGSLVFMSCHNLSAVTFLGNKPTIQSTTFRTVAAGCKAIVDPTKEGWPNEGSNWNGLIIEYKSE